MAKNNGSLTAAYDALPWLLRLILVLVLGVIVGGVYRIVKFFETGNIVTLVVGILATVTGVGNVLIWLIDVITTIIHGQFTVFVD